MKYSTVAALLMATGAMAQPHGHAHKHDKRAYAYEIVTETRIVYVSGTATWTEDSGASSTVNGQQFFETKQAKPETTTTSVEVPEPESTTAQTTFSSVVVPKQPKKQAAPKPETTSSSTTSVYIPPAPETTSVEVPEPEPTTSEAPKAEPTQEAAPAEEKTESSKGSSGGGSAKGQTYNGPMTWYEVGLGSCGETSSSGDAIAAIPLGVMGEQSNGNPNCGRSVMIKYGTRSKQVQAVDKCPGCGGSGIDVSSSVFEYLLEEDGGLDAGKVQVEWYFTS